MREGAAIPGGVASGPVYVLTLPEAADRQEAILRWSESHGLGREIFFHAPPSTLQGKDQKKRRNTAAQPESPATRLTYQRYGRDRLQAAELGCLIGHRRMYERMLGSASPWALILEDDVVPADPHWPSRLRQLMARMEASRLRNLPWVCHLGITPDVQHTLALRPVRWRTPSAGDASTGVGRISAPAVGQLDLRVGQLWTTHAYLISLKAARAILEGETPGTYVADDWAIRLGTGLINPMLATMSPLFVPNCSLPSQIPERTEFSASFSGLSLPHRIYRKLRTLVYRAGLRAAVY